MYHRWYIDGFRLSPHVPPVVHSPILTKHFQWLIWNIYRKVNDETFVEKESLIFKIYHFSYSVDRGMNARPSRTGHERAPINISLTVRDIQNLTLPLWSATSVSLIWRGMAVECWLWSSVDLSVSFSWQAKKKTFEMSWFWLPQTLW